METGSDGSTLVHGGQSSSSVELGELHGRRRRGSAHAYPMPDRGRDAWLFLWVGCFLTIALTWGFPFSYGIFQLYYSTHPPFINQSGLPAVGTTTLGILYLSSPICFIALKRYPSYRRAALILGTITVCLSLLTSAFATKVWHLFLTQGVLYGIGASVVNTVTIQFLNEWFIERKGLAFGIQESGAGMGGIILPVLMTWGLEKYGHRTMLIAWFIAVAVLSLPSIYFLRGRVAPEPPQRSRAGGLGDFRFIATPVFLLLQAGNILQALGNFLPGIHLPSFARGFGASSLDSAGMLSLYNAATVIGSVFTGWLVDRYHISVSLLLLSLGAASVVFLAWGFASDFGELCAFAFLYGLFAGGWSSTWVGVSLEVQRRSPRADLTVLWGFAAAARGVGSIASGPVSEGLIGGVRGDTAGWPRGYGTVYGTLILFTGGMLALGGVGSALRGYEIVRKRRVDRGRTS